jgi:hypothetical protein
MKSPHPVKFDAVALQAAQIFRGGCARALAKLQLIITEQFGCYRGQEAQFCTSERLRESIVRVKAVLAGRSVGGECSSVVQRLQIYEVA